jgi:hypothetical protein
MAATVSKTPIMRIGAASKGEGVRLLDAQGKEIVIEDGGFDHFARRG